MLAQIPFGGITTGGTTLKTPDQQLAFGGLAGEPLDPCYYEECDNLFNTSLSALDLNGDAIATAAITFAMGTGSGGGKDKNKPNAPAAVVTGRVLADR